MGRDSRLDRQHQRFIEQASWTAGIRRILLADLPSGADSRVLEVGAGTGAITIELAGRARGGRVFALDIDFAACRYGARSAPAASWHCADAQALPLPSGSLDGVVFHYVLLWLRDPLSALREARRVTRPGGEVLALAEPDHRARIDYPEPLETIGDLQTEALRKQGADTTIGRRLRGLFAAAGLGDVRAGVIGGEWAGPTGTGPPRSEWPTLREDLAASLAPAELDALEHLDREAWARGERVLFVPTFYASGRVR